MQLLFLADHSSPLFEVLPQAITHETDHVLVVCPDMTSVMHVFHNAPIDLLIMEEGVNVVEMHRLLKPKLAARNCSFLILARIAVAAAARYCQFEDDAYFLELPFSAVDFCGTLDRIAECRARKR